MSTYVIVGGGLAGTRTAEELRDLDGDARIVLVAGEAALPYDRPPLTKDYLLGAKQENDIVLHDAGWFTDNQIELHAENPDYPTIVVQPGDPFEIEGRAVGLIRNSMLM